MPQLGPILSVVLGRLTVGVVLGGVLLVPGAMPSSSMLKGALIALFCPVSGVSMKYVLDFGYDSSLQAATMSTSNVLSLLILAGLIQLEE